MMTMREEDLLQYEVINHLLSVRLRFTRVGPDVSGLADWWSHPTFGELLVVRPEAGDYRIRTRELVSDLSEKLGCPSDHDLRLVWMLNSSQVDGRLIAPDSEPERDDLKTTTETS